MISIEAMRTAGRGLAVLAGAAVFLVRSTGRLMVSRLRGGGTGADLIAAEEFANIAKRLGGAWVKVAQLLATRRDLCTDRAATVLAALHGQAGLRQGAWRKEQVAAVLGRCGIKAELMDAGPVASGSIALIYRVKAGGSNEPLILKLRRRGIQATIAADLRLLKGLAAVAGMLPPLRHIPLRAMSEAISAEVAAQLSLKREARNIERFRRNFAGQMACFPTVEAELAGEEFLLLSNEANLIKIDGALRDLPNADTVYDRLIRQVYTMIFVHGFFHCDLHPGNVFARSNGEIVYLDCGLATELTEDERDDLADFFLCVALNRGKRAADLLLRKALQVPQDIDRRRFEREIAAVVDSVAGVRAGQFSVARFVAAMFDVNRRHGVVGTAAFTWMIAVLLTIEGPIKAACPRMDFQAAAIQVITDARLAGAAA